MWESVKCSNSLPKSCRVCLWYQRHKCHSFNSGNSCTSSSCSPECTNCDYSEPIMDNRLEFILYEKAVTPKFTCQWLGSLEHETHEKHPDCSSALIQLINFKSAPNVLVFEINSRNIKISKTLKFVQNGEAVVLDVRGLIYHGDFHFTSCIIGADGIVWYHDGITTCENEGDFDKFTSKKMLRCKGKGLLLVVYARV
jgi:hypothetical protein